MGQIKLNEGKFLQSVYLLRDRTNTYKIFENKAKMEPEAEILDILESLLNILCSNLSTELRSQTVNQCENVKWMDCWWLRMKEHC